MNITMPCNNKKCDFLEEQFLVCPRDFLTKKILLAPKTVSALHNAAKTLRRNSNGQYVLVLTRGYIYWGKWRWFCEQLAKFIFHSLYWSDRATSESLFGHNGHNDGYSVDVQLYDLSHNKKTQWLSWKNIMIPRIQAEKIIELNKETIHMLDTAMANANFTSHIDPREKLQMHYRLNVQDEHATLIECKGYLHSGPTKSQSLPKLSK